MISWIRTYLEPKEALIGKSKEKYSFKPSKSVMRYHEGTYFMLYHYSIKVFQ